MGLPLIKVYLNEAGSLVVVYRQLKTVGNPSLFLVKYFSFNDQFPENDRVTLSWGRGDIFTDKYPHQIVDEDDMQVGTLEDVKAYFTSLGIGQPSGGTNIVTDPTVIDGSTNPPTGNAVFDYAYSRSYIDNQIALLYEAIGVAPPVKIATPSGTFSGITSSAVTLTLSVLANATTYEFSRNGSVVQTGASLILNDTGLTPETEYIYSWVAKGAGFTDSDAGSGNITTAEAGQTALILPFTLPGLLTA